MYIIGQVKKHLYVHFIPVNGHKAKSLFDVKHFLIELNLNLENFGRQ